MIIKRFNAGIILNSRGEKTISVLVKTDNGEFSASAPSGKSKGRHEALAYIKDINHDIKLINSKKALKTDLTELEDLKKIEKIFKGKIGANSLFALEAALLKAAAKHEGREVWQLINPNRKKFPMPVGNVIGGGLHSHIIPKPNFQEFLFIPETSSFKDAVEINKRALENCREILKNLDKKFKGKKNDENAWQTSIGDEQVLSVMSDVKENMLDEFSGKVHTGIDAAASTFFKKGRYAYENPRKILTKDGQISYILQLIKNYALYYIEDPLNEEDFSGFSEITERARSLIVGDDLTVTSLARIKKAKAKNSINALIVKPNQNGSLISVSEIIKYCKKNDILTIMSHRSGETNDNIIADLAFGFQTDFIKTGIVGKEREAKLNRLIEISKSI